jgi:catecholate siderophore receptor
VLKGPSSTLLGRGTTGGGINTSSKIPYLDDGASATLAGGSADYQRATIDYNKKLGDGMAVRLNAMVHHQGVEGRDFIESDRWGIAPSIGFGLDGPTTFTLSMLYQKDDRVPDYGIPTVQISSPRPGEPLRTVAVPYTNFGVKSTNFYGYDADVDHTKVLTVTAKLRHEVNDWLTLTSDTKFGDYWRYFRQTVPNACNAACSTAFTDNNPATIPLVAIGGPGPYDQTTLGVQNVSIASVTAPIAGFKNEAMAGWDVSWQTNDRDQFNYYPAGDARTRAPKNVFDPIHSPSPALTAVKNNTRKSSAKDVSLFLSDRFWFNDQWSVKAGVRAQWYEFDQDQTNFVASTTNPDVLASTNFAPLSSNSDFVSPSISVIWEPSDAYTVYASYATSATPPGITVSNGSTISGPGAGASISTKDLDPEKNESYELGIRAQILPQMMLQAAIFDVKKNNAKETDPLSNLIITSGDSQEAKGVEIGLAGNITQTWGYNFTYAYTDAQTTESTNPGNIGKQVVYTPKNAASLWTTYNFDEGILAGLQTGLGVTYQDRVLLANTGYNPGAPLATPAVAPTAAAFSQAPSYITFDAMASYGWDRFRLSINAYNLADELFFSQVNSNRVVPAPGRYFIATLGVVY